jgi:tripeptide aminopeptidase
MMLLSHLQKHPEIKHGTLRIAFTPDEEVGAGTEHFDVRKFAADFAYTVDGETLGEIEIETFNAALPPSRCMAIMSIPVTLKAKWSMPFRSRPRSFV